MSLRQRVRNRFLLSILSGIFAFGLWIGATIDFVDFDQNCTTNCASTFLLWIIFSVASYAFAILAGAHAVEALHFVPLDEYPEVKKQ